MVVKQNKQQKKLILALILDVRLMPKAMNLLLGLNKLFCVHWQEFLHLLRKNNPLSHRIGVNYRNSIHKENGTGSKLW